MAARSRSRVGRAIRRVILVVLIVLAIPYLLVPVYSVANPVSTLMLARWFTGQSVTREWVNIGAVAPIVPLTVIGAEDAKFCTHHGIDWDALQEVISDVQEGDATRGGSTITQQVAKNLFLWNGRSYLRKGLEFPLALWIDLVLSKRRIMEIYLNIAEWGPDGQFGIEAGAQHAFRRSSSDLNPSEAALLTSILPNPVTRNAGRPGPGVRRMAARYVARARQAPEIVRCLGLRAQ